MIRRPASRIVSSRRADCCSRSSSSAYARMPKSAADTAGRIVAAMPRAMIGRCRFSGSKRAIVARRTSFTKTMPQVPRNATSPHCERRWARAAAQAAPVPMVALLPRDQLRADQVADMRQVFAQATGAEGAAPEQRVEVPADPGCSLARLAHQLHVGCREAPSQRRQCLLLATELGEQAIGDPAALPAAVLVEGGDGRDGDEPNQLERR